MGEHDAPLSWLERWQEQEPLRLWLWTVACSVIVLAGVAGWLTQELAVAVTGVAAAVLMLGGTAGARRRAYAPATVDRLLEEQHALSYRQAERDTLRLQLEEAAPPQDVPPAVPATVALRAQQPATTPRGAALPPRRCREVRDGRRCTLPEHPETVGHRLEEGPARE